MGGKCNGFILVGSFLPLSITVSMASYVKYGSCAPRCNGGLRPPHAVDNIYKIIPTLKIVQRARQPRLPFPRHVCV